MFEVVVGEPSKPDPHPDIASAVDLRAFHDRHSRRQQLAAAGLPWVVAVLVPVVLLVAPALVLDYVFAIDSDVVQFPILGVAAVNATLTLVALGILDDRLCETMCRIRPAFDADDETYFGFQGRLFEKLYQESLYAPVFPGPDGRRLPLVWSASFVVVFASLFALVAGVTQMPPLVAEPASVLFYGYLLYQVGFGALTIVTLLSLVWVAWLFMGYRVMAFTIVLEHLRNPDQPGLYPYGRLLFNAPLPGFLAAALTGVIGLAVGDIILLVTASIATFVLVFAFVGGQVGLNRAIVRSKEARLRDLELQYQDRLEEVFHPQASETTPDAIRDSEAYLAVKREIESLPEWPTSLVNVYQFTFVVVLSNVPTLLEFLIL